VYIVKMYTSVDEMTDCDCALHTAYLARGVNRSKVIEQRYLVLGNSPSRLRVEEPSVISFPVQVFRRRCIL
jgi:hypothetical protein